MENWREGEKEKPGFPLLLCGGVSYCGRTSVPAPASARQTLHAASFCWVPQAHGHLLSSLFLKPRLILCFCCCPSLVFSLSPFQLFCHLCDQGSELNSLLSNAKNNFCFLD